ncbi:OsmC family protein [Rubellicoccus peritrichatus]|uniref:OsmC family protein n=1 Tax=Rubellicoccus peritrichatus TaxID=3080537 RepID=A0AAQ3LGV4_9BACT|nr:OsmC family protein [Puniceicoccus sp. CR14]WOO41914.1 OsmC family protein [Puniceicoccus sp. CR14]
MVSITATYDGDLRCTATHGPSGSTLTTDAPLDNQGKGEAFSPTDLCATALITCIATTMAIKARSMGIELGKMEMSVEKHMSLKNPRRIARLPVEIKIGDILDEKQKTRLERVAHACPVHHSLHPDIEMPITITWGDESPE